MQIDEPALALDLPDEWRLAYLKAYERLSGPCKLLLTTYFGSVAHQRDIITSLKVDGLHLDLVAAPSSSRPWSRTCRPSGYSRRVSSTAATSGVPTWPSWRRPSRP